MARHESEMHRQRRELLEALQQAAAGFAVIKNHASDKFIKDFALDHFKACRAAATAIAPCNIGLFADHRQLDLQDRKDV